MNSLNLQSGPLSSSRMQGSRQNVFISGFPVESGMTESESNIMYTGNQLARKFMAALLLFMSIFLLQAGTTSAASSITANGITVSPAIVNLDISAGQPTTSFKVDITNNSTATVTLKISSLDFKSLNSTGGVAFIGNSITQAAGKNSLSPWIDTAKDPITIAAKQTRTINIVIENRADLGPGGHYAAVLYTVTNDSSTGSSTLVNVNEVASTLVFVRKIDGAQFAINLNKPKITYSLWHIPSNVDLFFTNTGNIQVVPRGLITIASPLSKEVSRGQINTDSALVLPDSTRLYRTSLFRTGLAWLPGVYKVHIFYHPDGIDNLQYSDQTFVFVNLPAIIAFGLIIVIARLIYRQFKHLIKLRKKISPASQKNKRITIKIN